MSDTGRLFDPGPATPRGGGSQATGQMPPWAPIDGVTVRVLPDVSGLDKEFDYVVPAAMAGPVSVGTEVRVELGARRVNGWITEVAPSSPHGDPGPSTPALRPIVAIRSAGPSPEVVDLARWAARRWHGRLGAILKTASAPRVVRSLPPAEGPSPTSAILRSSGPLVGPVTGISDVSVIRHGPGDDVLGWLVEAAERGSTLVVVPRLGLARSLAGRLRQRGITVRVHPRDWAAAASRGGLVIGARSAVWASVADLATVVVVDEHDEGLQEERHPTWHARDVAIERARRAGISCWLLSPAPTLEAVMAADHHRSPGRSRERAEWPLVELIDRRNDEPGRGGLFSSRLVEVLREPGTVLAVLNRKGRAVMLACWACGEPALTDDGERMMVERDGRLVCRTTGETRPLICVHCGSTRMKRLRLGVTRAAEELSALVGEPVDELSADTGPDERAMSRSRVVVGTEAALHQLMTVDTVAFLDFDQELLAHRYRSAEQAMVLLVRAAQLTGGREAGGRLLVQTRVPGHRVLDAAVRADPGRLVEGESAMRRAVGFPPFGALAELSGPGAADFAAAVGQAATEFARDAPSEAGVGDPISVLGPRTDGRYLVRAPDAEQLAAVLAAAPRPAERVRVAVDPLRA